MIGCTDSFDVFVMLFFISSINKAWTNADVQVSFGEVEASEFASAEKSVTVSNVGSAGVNGTLGITGSKANSVFSEAVSGLEVYACSDVRVNSGAFEAGSVPAGVYIIRQGTDNFKNAKNK